MKKFTGLRVSPAIFRLYTNLMVFSHPVNNLRLNGQAAFAGVSNSP